MSQPNTSASEVGAVAPTARQPHRFLDLEQLDDAREASHNPSSERDIRDWVAVGLARLPDEQRKVLELAYHLGHSCAEIAVTMNCPVGTVKTRMYHGRQSLKYMLPNLAGLSRDTAPRKCLPEEGQR
jgi:DNA-directed RNA polymerase specialized sigma24 family protein